MALLTNPVCQQARLSDIRPAVVFETMVELESELNSTIYRAEGEDGLYEGDGHQLTTLHRELTSVVPH